MTKYVSVLVDKSTANSVARIALWNSDRDIASQFLWSARGGEEGKTRCITLQNPRTEEHVGFLGLSLSIENLDSLINVYVSVEFVYLNSDHRGKGLTKYFVRWVTDQVLELLDSNMHGWTGRKVILYSASNPKTDGGTAFLERLESELRPIARARKLDFTSSLDGG